MPYMKLDWRRCDDLYELGAFLATLPRYRAVVWREFHCMCSRAVWSHLTAGARRTIEKAEGSCMGRVSPTSLKEIHQAAANTTDAAWERVWELREQDRGPDMIWPVSEEVDDAWD